MVKIYIILNIRSRRASLEGPADIAAADSSIDRARDASPEQGEQNATSSPHAQGSRKMDPSLVN